MPDLNQLQKDLKRLHEEIKQFPRKAAYIVENHSHKAFASNSWDGKPWQKRKSKDSSDRNNPDKPRALMTKTRTLQRSIKKTATPNSVVISSNVKYAKIHNEGGVIKHPGGTPYLPFTSRFTARKTKGRIGNMKNQMIFIKKSQMGKFPQAKLPKPHDRPIPKRQFMGYSVALFKELEKELDTIIIKAK